MIDQESYGRADSLEQINLYATGTLETYIPKFKTLILNWNFNNLSASQTDGTFLSMIILRVLLTTKDTVDIVATSIGNIRV